MSYRLIISEKPSVSAAVAYCIGATEKISEGNTFYWQGNGYIVTNALGHLFGIGMPDDYGFEKWDIDTLPIIPQEFKLFPLRGYGEQIKMLKKLLSRDDVTEVINACDAGREGECIFRYIYKYFGCNKPVKRLWISSLTDESIRQGMAHLLDGSEKDSLFSAGFARAKADWIFGMSLSRLYSILNDDRHKVGRVKTPVLNIIAKRYEAIAAFTKVPFYKVVLENGAECEKVFDTSEQAETVRAKCEGKTVTVYSVKSERKKENCPLLHSLTSLQREANDIYGMTAADTLKAAQSLYEKKLITYPRTDSNYLSDDMISLVKSIVKCLSSYDDERISRLLTDGLNIDNRVIDNGKISDHHAIIPTNLIGRLDSTDLSGNEKNVVELVINRFLCTLDKPYFYTETKYEFTCEGEIFKLTVKTPEQLGWRRYYASKQMIILIKVCESRSKNTFISKIVAFGILIILTQFLISVCEYFFMQGSIGREGLGYPIQSLEYFGGCEYNITILETFIFIGILKATGYIFLFSLIAFLSTLWKKAVISVSVPLVICLIQQFVFSDKSMGYYISTGLLRAVGFFRGDAYETQVYYGNEVMEKVFSAVSKSDMIGIIIISMFLSLVFLTVGYRYYKGHRKISTILAAVLPLIFLLGGCGQNSGNELPNMYYNLKSASVFAQNDKIYYYFDNERNVTAVENGKIFAAVREPFDSKLWVDNFCVADNKMYLFQYVSLNSFSLYELDLDTYHIEEICGQIGEPNYSFLGLRFDSNVVFDKTVLYAFTNGERLFFVTSDSEVYECGMNLHGSECIVSDGIYGNNLIYNGKEIYYINNKLELVRYDVNKKNRIILPMNFARAFDVDNEKIIYSSNDGIYTYDIIDKTEEKISELTSDNILIDGNNVFFSSENVLYLYDIDKNKCREIYDEGFVDFSIIKGKNSILCTKYLPKDECFEKFILNY